MLESMEGDRYFPSQPFVVTADCRSLLGTVVARLNDRNCIATFIEKLAHCL